MNSQAYMSQTDVFILFDHIAAHVTSYSEYDNAYVGISKEHFQEYFPYGIGLMQQRMPVCGSAYPRQSLLGYPTMGITFPRNGTCHLDKLASPPIPPPT